MSTQCPTCDQPSDGSQCAVCLELADLAGKDDLVMEVIKTCNLPSGLPVKTTWQMEYALHALTPNIWRRLVQNPAASLMPASRDEWLPYTPQPEDSAECTTALSIEDRCESHGCGPDLLDLPSGQICPQCQSPLETDESYPGGGNHYWLLSCTHCATRYSYSTYDWSLYIQDKHNPL